MKIMSDYAYAYTCTVFPKLVVSLVQQKKRNKTSSSSAGVLEQKGQR